MPVATSTTPDQLDEPAFADTVRFLAENGDGRDNLSDGSRIAQDRLVEELEPIAEAVPGGDGFLHAFDQGTNVLAVIEGTTAPSEVVVLGAHYDGLGHDCPTDDPGDDVCDGAGDNAAGVAAVLEIGRRLAADPPARSVLLALWDAEEDDKLGSIAAVQSGVLGSIRLPTLLLYGEHDNRPPPGVATELHDEIPNSKLIQLPGAGHLCNVDASDSFNAHLRRFLQPAQLPLSDHAGGAAPRAPRPIDRGRATARCDPIS